jgi:hypothetical protein
MIKLEVNKEYYYCGDSPLDLEFLVEIKFIDDDNKEKYVYEIRTQYALECGIITKSLFKQRTDNMEQYVIERYHTVKESKGSKYYKLLKDVDFVTGKYSDEVYDMEDDTKYTGPRCSAMFTKDGLTYFMESCSHINKTDKYYYIQVKCNNGKYHYSVTEKSMFLRIMLGDVLYFTYFDNKNKEIPNLISSDNIDDLEEIEYMKEDALKDKMLLDKYIKKINSSN